MPDAHQPDRESTAVRDELDARCAGVIAILEDAGFFPGRAGHFSAAAYHEFAQCVNEAFEVPQTSITTAAARLLFAIAESARPRHIAVLGSYYGNSMVWLVGPSILKSERQLEHAEGYDIDALAVAGAVQNMARLAPTAPVFFRHADAFSLPTISPAAIDLLLIDIDAADGRKSGYAALLEVTLPYLSAGAIVLAHDRCEPKFANDFEPYLAIVRDPDRFAVSTAIPIDAAGFEVTLLW